MASSAKWLWLNRLPSWATGPCVHVALRRLGWKLERIDKRVGDPTARAIFTSGSEAEDALQKALLWGVFFCNRELEVDVWWQPRVQVADTYSLVRCASLSSNSTATPSSDGEDDLSSSEGGSPAKSSLKLVGGSFARLMAPAFPVPRVATAAQGRGLEVVASRPSDGCTWAYAVPSAGRIHFVKGGPRSIELDHRPGDRPIAELGAFLWEAHPRQGPVVRPSSIVIFLQQLQVMRAKSGCERALRIQCLWSLAEKCRLLCACPWFARRDPASARVARAGDFAVTSGPSVSPNESNTASSSGSQLGISKCPAAQAAGASRRPHGLEVDVGSDVEIVPFKVSRSRGEGSVGSLPPGRVPRLRELTPDGGAGQCARRPRGEVHANRFADGDLSPVRSTSTRARMRAPTLIQDVFQRNILLQEGETIGEPLRLRLGGGLAHDEDRGQGQPFFEPQYQQEPASPAGSAGYFALDDGGDRDGDRFGAMQRDEDGVEEGASPFGAAILDATLDRDWDWAQSEGEGPEDISPVGRRCWAAAAAADGGPGTLFHAGLDGDISPVGRRRGDGEISPIRRLLRGARQPPGPSC